MSFYADSLSPTVLMRPIIGAIFTKTVGASAAPHNKDAGIKTPLSSSISDAYLFNFVELKHLFVEVDALINENDYDDDFLQPTEYAISKTRKLLLGLIKAVFRIPTKGSSSTDGSGNVRIEWRKGKKEIRLVIPAAQSGQTYIYYEDASTYGTDKNVSVGALLNRLRWLVD